MKNIWIITVLLFAGAVNADSMFCKPQNSSGYCQYNGKVASLYVNKSKHILMYFENPMNDGLPSSAGISGVSEYGAGLVDLGEYPEFGQLFYSTAMAAQAQGKNVKVQMRGTAYGYMKIDRIWLAQ